MHWLILRMLYKELGYRGSGSLNPIFLALTTKKRWAEVTQTRVQTSFCATHKVLRTDEATPTRAPELLPEASSMPPLPPQSRLISNPLGVFTLSKRQEWFSLLSTH